MIRATSTSAKRAAPTLDPALIRRYDGSGPRYTSYPTADRFTEAFTAEHYANALALRNQSRAAQPLSLYVHLPFCDSICYYCACNKIITKDHSRSAKYVRYLQQEIAMVGGLLEGDRVIAQLHWGGGTPTFLSHDEMAALIDSLKTQFVFTPDAEVSIEVDPRKVNAATIAFLASLGFNRLSIGVQDFDTVVQIAVNRIQSESQTRTVIDAARANGFKSINVDLIYGLPRQTLRGFAATLDKVANAKPDRIALYSYAYVPHLFKPQRSIPEADLPSADTKLAILALAVEKLSAAGYVYIGMDHFAKPDDELAKAQRTRRLHRNFQGYSTKPDCDLIGFGISAIGKIGTAYVQNMKTLDAYYTCLDALALPVARGIELDDDDIVRRDVIQKLMCDFAVEFADIESRHAIHFIDYFAAELDALAPFETDGLITLSSDAIAVTPRGKWLVRSIAMAFDRRLREARERARYSRVI